MVAEADGIDISFRPLGIVGRLPDRSLLEAVSGGSRAVIGAGFCRLLGYLFRKDVWVSRMVQGVKDGSEQLCTERAAVNLWRRVNLLTPMW